MPPLSLLHFFSCTFKSTDSPRSQTVELLRIQLRNCACDEAHSMWVVHVENRRAQLLLEKAAHPSVLDLDGSRNPGFRKSRLAQHLSTRPPFLHLGSLTDTTLSLLSHLRIRDKLRKHANWTCAASQYFLASYQRPP